MKKLLIFTLAAFTAFSLTQCNNADSGPVNSSTINSTSSAAKSDNLASNEYDKAMENVDSLVNQSISDPNKRVAAYNLPCGVVKVVQTGNSFSIQYGDKTPCGYKKVSGEIKYELKSGTQFSDAGAVLEVTFVDYQVIVNATGESIIINGKQLVTNVTGGSLYHLLTTDNTHVKHTVSGELAVTFVDASGNKVRTRKLHKVKEWTRTTGITSLTFEAYGDSASVWENGYNKEGNPYYTKINEHFTWVYCSNRSAFILEKGLAEATFTSKDTPSATGTFTVEAGYNSSGHKAAKDCSADEYLIRTVIPIIKYDKTEYQLY